MEAMKGTSSSLPNDIAFVLLWLNSVTRSAVTLNASPKARRTDFDVGYHLYTARSGNSELGPDPIEIRNKIPRAAYR